MKKLSFISLILFVFFASFKVAPAQKAADQIAAVRREVAAIDKNLGKYAKQIKTVEGVSLEGAEAVFYSSGKVLKKIHADLAGETYRATADLYYKDEKLIFVYYRRSRYDTQIGLEKPPKVVKIEERRLYFANGELTKLVAGKTTVKPGSEQFNKSKTEITELSDKLRAGLSEPN